MLEFSWCRIKVGHVTVKTFSQALFSGFSSSLFLFVYSIILELITPKHRLYASSSIILELEAKYQEYLLGILRQSDGFCSCGSWDHFASARVPILWSECVCSREQRYRCIQPVQT